MVTKLLVMLDAMEEMERTVYGQMIEMIERKIAKNKVRQAEIWYSECVFRSGTRSLTTLKADQVTIEFDMSIENEVVEGVIGYCDSKTQVIAYSSLFIMLRLNALGSFEAMDGAVFRAATPIPYSRNCQYHVRIEADFARQVYSISIHDGNSLRWLGKDFHFNTLIHDPADLDKITVVHDNMSSFKVMNHMMQPVEN